MEHTFSFNNREFNAFSEEELVPLAKGGNQSAASELVARMYSLVYYASEKFLGIGIERADLIQEGMIALLYAVQHFKPQNGASFKTYAGRCIYNRYSSLAREVLQKKHIPKEKIVSLDYIVQEDTQNPEQLVIEKERIEEITAAVQAKLSSFEYSVFQKYLSGYSAAEIADSFGINVKQVNNALYRIRQKFHFILK